MKSSTSLNKLNNHESDLDLHDSKQSKRYVHSASPLRNHAALRKGKWTVEEEKYADKIIYMFNKGILQIPTGTTLRSYLSEKLNCDPMRITKKFAGPSCIGKQIFQPFEDRGGTPLSSSSSSSSRNIDLSPTEIHHNELELENLEKIFRSRQDGHIHNNFSATHHGSSFLGTQHHSHASLIDHHHKQTPTSSSSSSSHSKGLSYNLDNHDINYNHYSPLSSSSDAGAQLMPWSDTDPIDHSNNITLKAGQKQSSHHHTHSRSHSSTDAEDSGGDDHYLKPSRMAGKDNINNSSSNSGGMKMISSSGTSFVALSPKTTSSNIGGLISNQSNASISTHDSSGNNSTNNSGGVGGILMRRAISAPELQDLEVKWPKLTKKQQKQQQLLFNSNNINMNVESVPIKHLKGYYNNNHYPDKQYIIHKASTISSEITSGITASASAASSSVNINTIGMGMSRKRCQSMINLFDFDDYFGNDLAAGDLLLGFFNTLTENELSPNLQHKLKQQQPLSSQQLQGRGLEGFSPSLSLTLPLTLPPSLSRHISLSSKSDGSNRAVMAVLNGGENIISNNNDNDNNNGNKSDDIVKLELVEEPPVKRQAVELTTLPPTSDTTAHASSSASSSIDQDKKSGIKKEDVSREPVIVSNHPEHIDINSNPTSSSNRSSSSSTGSRSHETSESSDLDTIDNNNNLQCQPPPPPQQLQLQQQPAEDQLHHHHIHSIQSRENMQRRESVSSSHAGSTDDDSHTHLSHLHPIQQPSSPLHMQLQQQHETKDHSDSSEVVNSHERDTEEEGDDHEVGLSLED